MGEDIRELWAALVPEADDAPVRSAPRRGFCVCRNYVVDHRVRRVFCRECGEEVPAFDALARFARDLERHERLRDAAHAAARDAQQKLDDLKRQIRNAKAQLRRYAK